MWVEICRTEFVWWNDAGRQTGKHADEQTKRQKFVCWLQNINWKFRLQCKIWLIDANRQNRRNVDFADNVARQKKKFSIWSMFFWESCQKVDLMNVDRKTKTEYWLIFKQHRSWFFLKRVSSCCRINKIDRDFFWNAYRSNCQQIDQIDVFLKIVFDDLFFVQSFNWFANADRCLFEDRVSSIIDQCRDNYGDWTFLIT